MDTRIKSRTILSVAAVLLIFAALVGLAGRVLQPKYMTDLVEGSMLPQYYREYGGHDVIFIGDCEVYANFTPMEMYDEAGVTAYVRGSSQQLIWQSYYILEETLTYETPKAVVYNVNAMRYGEPVSEAYNRLTIDGLRWSRQKIAMIFASMTREEDFLSYVFPVLRYHSRFDELTEEDLRYLFATRDNTYSGHLVNKNVKPLENLPAQRPLADYSFPEICYEYLDKMRALCQEHGVELVLIKAPSVYPFWYDEYDAQIEQYAQQYGLRYYNLLDHAQEIGIDYTQDTYDSGLHLNLTGASKLSRWFARVLSQDLSLEDRRQDPALGPIFNEKWQRYAADVYN